MRVLRWSVAVLATASVVGVPAVEARVEHGWHVRCGDGLHPLGYGWFDSKGFNVSCRTVRQVADRYTFDEPGDENFNGWRCDDDRIATEIWRVDCTRRRGEHEHVRFKFGA
jgi:hypothetical protein